jgi:CO/xanthine dehydrogenase Mo-binding subunit
MTIGDRVPRGDGPEKVTGQAKYTADMTMTGMLHARFLYAERPRARIIEINTTAAQVLPGVFAVITQADMLDVRYGFFVKDRTLFAKDDVRFEAEVVAAVAALTPEIAAHALDLIKVGYEDLEPILNVEDALRLDSDLVHQQFASYEQMPGVDRDRNDCGHMTSVKGNVDAGFAEADVVVSARYRSDMSHAVPIEPHAVIAEWQGDRVTIWSTSQVPFPARAGVARTLGISESNVRIIVPHLGGGFGGKCDFHFEAHIAALAKVTRRPVKLVFTRREEFLATDKPRHAAIIDLETGVKNDGTITARRAKIILDGGAYTGDSHFATEIGLMMIQGPYRIPNLSAEAHTVYTNRTPSGSVRAPGAPQTCWAVEQHTEEIAEKLGMHPIDFRRKNLVQDGDTGQTGQRFDNPTATECLDRALEMAGYGQELPDGEAFGVACGWWFSLPVPSGAYVKLNADGSGTIVTGAQENGSGSVMGLPALAAEELGMTPEQFSIVYQDTSAGPFDVGSAGSQTTMNNGRAVIDAARQVRDEILRLAADTLEASVDDLELVDGVVRVRGAPTVSVTLVELAAQAHGGELLLGKGSGQPLPMPEHDISDCVGRLIYPAFTHPSFFCHVGRVRVDKDTGVVQVLDWSAAFDFGRILNPIGAEGQVEGGTVQGIGFALLEGSTYKDGHQTNPSLLEYKLQTAIDAPPIKVAFIGGPAPAGPHGARAVGEPPVVGPPAAIANAIAAATGSRIRHLPMTPERVWEGMQAAAVN